jgi:hypothetical protein
VVAGVLQAAAPPAGGIASRFVLPVWDWRPLFGWAAALALAASARACRIGGLEAASRSNISAVLIRSGRWKTFVYLVADHVHDLSFHQDAGPVRISGDRAQIRVRQPRSPWSITSAPSWKPSHSVCLCRLGRRGTMIAAMTLSLLVSQWAFSARRLMIGAFLMQAGCGAPGDSGMTVW